MNEICSSCGSAKVSVELVDCKHVIDCLRCNPWLSKDQTCPVCGVVPTRMRSVALGDDETIESDKVCHFKYLGILWDLKRSTGDSYRLTKDLAHTLRLRPDKMILLLNGTSYKPGHFKHAFELATTSSKPATLLATPETKHDQVEAIEATIARDVRNQNIRAVFATIYTAIKAFFETIWLFFISLVWPFPPRPIGFPNGVADNDRAHRD